MRILMKINLVGECFEMTDNTRIAELPQVPEAKGFDEVVCAALDHPWICSLWRSGICAASAWRSWWTTGDAPRPAAISCPACSIA